MIDYVLKVNPHSLRCSVIKDFDFIEAYYRMRQHQFGIVNTESELMQLIEEG